jgi:hypothetical protein
VLFDVFAVRLLLWTAEEEEVVDLWATLGIVVVVVFRLINVIPVEEELLANVCEQLLSLSDQQLVVRDLLSQEQLQCPLLLLQRCGL